MGSGVQLDVDAFTMPRPETFAILTPKATGGMRGATRRAKLRQNSGLFLLAVPFLAMAKAIELKLREGDPAPEFTAATSGGGTINLAQFRGSNVILYFYPKDDTPGCTKEACGFRDGFSEFQKKGVVVLGVSTDPVKTHDKFVGKFKLPFPLLADVDRKIVEAYGVWGEKSFMGRKYQGTHRVTFLIGPDGMIRRIWPAVKPEEHVREVLEAI
jgi:peroxiredoxin Q/BCP